MFTLPVQHVQESKPGGHARAQELEEMRNKALNDAPGTEDQDNLDEEKKVFPKW